MEFWKISEDIRVSRLQPPVGKRVRMVLDTDTFNEIDDQFAVVYALEAKDRMDVEAIYAAPFHNNRSTGPADGMEKSYEEIQRLLGMLNQPADGLTYRGSDRFLKDQNSPCESDAARDLVRRAMDTPADADPLYVVAIGAITNVASAILIEPSIVERIVVVWLGGNALYWPSTREFNLSQDIHASRLIFDCGVPLVHVPCQNVVTHLATTLPELRHYLSGAGQIGDYLVEIVDQYRGDHGGSGTWSKVIWDIAAVAWLVSPRFVGTDLVHSPILTDQHTWSRSTSRHLIRTVTGLDRDAIFNDLFRRIRERADD